MADNGCGCGCSQMTTITKAEESCACGCECCAPAAIDRDEEIAELRRVRDAATKRLEELEVG